MSISYYKYRLPFVDPMQTSQQIFDYREGIILTYNSGEQIFVGEAAPLPKYSTESIEKLETTIQQLQDKIAKTFESDDPVIACKELYAKNDLPPSLQFGLDSIAYQCKSYNEGISFTEYLSTESGYSMPTIPVNALESLHSKDIVTNIKKRLEEGFKTIKFKICIDFDAELHQLKKIRSEFPELKIRLDANQAWSTEQAVANCKKLESLDIEYCEEPLENPTPKSLEELSQNTSLAIAIDESVIQTTFWPNLLPFSSFIILKPMLLGNFTKIFETKRLADTHNNKAVFTTSLESGIGRIITAALASGIGSTKTAHGLNTGSLFSKDVLSDLTFISSGRFHLNKVSFPLKLDTRKLNDVASSLF